MDYQEFIKMANKGEPIGVEPAEARKFFTNTDKALVKEKIGEPLSMQRFVVKMCYHLEHICLLASIIISIFALKWYSIIAIPIMFFFSFYLGGLASMGRQRVRGAIYLVIICYVNAYFFREYGIFMFVWLILLPLPYLFARLTYKLATIFVRSLSIRNEKAFNLLYDRVIRFKALTEVIYVLQKYGKNQEDIEEIYSLLLASGAGEYVAQSVVTSPKLLSEYLQMEANGVSELEIVSKLSETLGKS